ncbi:MAG: hypothetical protein AAGB29_10680, partial [Planctomycetota bacterium]
MTTLNTTIDRSLAGVCQTTGSLKQRLRDAKAAILRAIVPVADGIDFFARGVFHVWRNRAYLTPIKLANIGLVELQ